VYRTHKTRAKNEPRLEKLVPNLYTGVLIEPRYKIVGEKMKPKLKVDLHMHSLEWKQRDLSQHPARHLIDIASQQGLEVLSITDHNVVTYDKDLVDYAAQRGILLIAGMEVTIQKKHVLLYNFDFANNHISTFEDIKRLKGDNNLCLAPHPFYPSYTSLKGELDRYWAVFDGLEFCHFYSKQINYNRKAMEKSQEYGLPLVGMSDAHMASQLGATYSLVEAEKQTESVIRAIKEGKLEVISQPLGVLRLGGISLKLLRDDVLGRLSKKERKKH
jgi:hypothetical protein